MSIYKRGDVWHINITAPSGERVRRSTGTTDRRQALEYHDKVKAELWEQSRLGVKPKYTFEQAAVKALEISAGQKSYADKVRHIRYWRDVFSGRTLCSLTSGEILNNLPTHNIINGKRLKLSNSTKNKYIATIGFLLNNAFKMGWLDRQVKIPRLKEPKVNVRWITADEAERLLCCIDNSWLRCVATFALYTGCRASEVLNLKWRDVDMSRATAWIGQGDTKSSFARSIPLNPDALAVLHERLGIHENYCFGRVEDRPSSAIDSKIFKRALKEAGIEDFTFHDLRHTWASWHAQAGTPLMVIKELGGWETLEMVMKYAHLATNHLAEHASNISNKKSAVSQIRHTSALRLVS